MKILIIVPSYKPAFIYGGTIYAIGSLCEALVAKGHEVTVFTTNANGVSELPVPIGQPMRVEGVTVYYYKRRTGDHGNFAPGLLKAFWQHAKKFDVVHVHAWWNFVTMPVLLICALKKMAPLLSPHGSITPYTVARQKTTIKQSFHSLAGKRLLQRAFIHVTTPQELSDCQALFTPLKSYVIPNLQALHDPIDVDRRSADKLRLLYFGRIDPKKNIEFILELLRQMQDIPYSLDIIGDGEVEYINQLKANANDIPGITWHDPIHSGEKWHRMAQADALLLPSRNENYGIVVIESLSQGTPVLLSDQVGLKDYVMQHDLGWVMPCDIALWKNALQKLWHNPGLRFEFRQRAPQVIQRDFNASTLILEYEKMYRETAEKNGIQVVPEASTLQV